MGKTKTAHISTHDNGFDLLTKVLYGAKRTKFVGKNIYDVYGLFVLFERLNPLHVDRN